MVRPAILSLALIIGQAIAAHAQPPPPPPPPVIRDPVPGPFFVYFKRGTAELDARQLDYLRTIPNYWNDDDGALILCSASDPAGSSDHDMRWRQIDRIKAELTTAGLRHLFLASGDCPAVGREIPEDRAAFVLYGVARL